MIKKLGNGLCPEAALEQFLLSPDSALTLRYEVTQHYLPAAPAIELLAIFFKNKCGLRLLLTDKLPQVEAALAAMAVPLSSDSLSLLGAGLAAPVFNLEHPLLLSPIAIAKPWGREIWYTGIEARGQSGFSDGEYSVPIPWLLALLPKRLLGAESVSLNLLKILDPLPEPVYGDLYFELHEEKREVYVVTHVDQQCWPDGEGGIRFGFAAKVRDEFADPEAFRQAYLQAVQNYEQVRRKIDGIFDQQRCDQGLDLNQPVAAGLLKQWHKSLAPELQQEEAALRKAMNRFTHMQGLREGDVVKVPCLTPHALQHGVRTVEFQTPVYERKILAFGQKVLTQDHWDTAEAVALMSLQSEAEQPLDVLEESEGLCREQVVAFDDFQVQRIALSPGARWQILLSERYKLLMVVAGNVGLGDGVTLKAEQAVLLPALGRPTIVSNCGREEAIVLLSQAHTA
ncbi:MAG: hypothetical protein KBT88_04220 [Gammaproteobacteria bacterium]|nr:hypothetical protein [Gammaproteobacteria bacterium]MBQ0838969.1 hypothetical protein [Gammaproteobacteria bacterium]